GPDGGDRARDPELEQRGSAPPVLHCRYELFRERRSDARGARRRRHARPMAVTDGQLRRHRALADPSRARILAELVSAGPLAARELADRVGLHVNTVRAHLNALAEAELVSSETLPPEGRGRPRVVYSATAAAGEESGRRYRL